MKKLLALFSIYLLLVSAGARAQDNATDSLPPYKKYPKLPSFNLLEMDSVTVFNTFNIPEGKPSVLMFFSPDCDHCQMLTDSITKHIPELKQAQFYMLTIMPFSATREFEEKLNLKQYKNIRVFIDKDFFFPRFYKASYVPYIVVYDRHKKLVKAYEGQVTINDLVQTIKGL